MQRKKLKVSTAQVGEVSLETRGKRGTYHVSFHFKGSHIRRSLKSTDKTQALGNLPGVLQDFLSSHGETTTTFERESEMTNSKGAPLKLGDGLDYYLDSLRDNGCEEEKGIGQARTRCTAFIEFEQ